MKSAAPVVHLELHTHDLTDACGFYTRVLGWGTERIELTRGSYLALRGAGIEGGVVECAAHRPLWLPYVEVEDLATVTDAARSLGASVPLEPREGPVGWRSVIASPAIGEVGLWQPKRAVPMSCRRGRSRRD